MHFACTVSFSFCAYVSSTEILFFHLLDRSTEVPQRLACVAHPANVNIASNESVGLQLRNPTRAKLLFPTKLLRTRVVARRHVVRALTDYSRVGNLTSTPALVATQLRLPLHYICGNSSHSGVSPPARRKRPTRHVTSCYIQRLLPVQQLTDRRRIQRTPWSPVSPICFEMHLRIFRESNQRLPNHMGR